MDFDPLLGLDEDYLLERERRLSDSMLWSLQRRFYEDHPEGFSSGTVPMYATTNVFIARAYAQLIHGFASDSDSREPVTIVELGAGHGRFGFLCLTHLLARFRRLGLVPPIRYVLTDFTDHSLVEWAAHPELESMIEEGWIDVARFDAERDDRLTLQHSGQVISPENPCGPMVVIANYVFDGLIQDAFRIRDGCLEEGQVTLVADHPWPQAGAPGLLAQLSALFTFSPLADAPVYADQKLNDILEFYKHNLGNGAFALPTGAVRCMDTLQAMSTGPMLVLSSDKAHNHLHQLQGHSAPEVTTHGCISMMTNHDALARYVASGGGQTLLTSARSGELETAAFVVGGPVDGHLSLAFDDAVECFSPSDYLDLFKSSTPFSLSDGLKLLQLSGWDPGWLCQLIPMLLRGLSDATAVQKAELLAGLDRADALVFPLVGEDRRVEIDELRQAVGV